jgi:membrane protein YdbS with pleckstrin-like domain
MALIQCPDCKRQVSSEAKVCPSCGYPIAERLQAGDIPAASAETGGLLLEVRPSWWKFFWHLVFFWLVIPLVVAIVRRNSFLMRIYSDRVSLERGVFTKEHRELFIKDIRSIDVDQTLLQRLVGIGDLTLSTAATLDAAEVIPGVPDPMRVKDLLIAQRQTLTG